MTCSAARATGLCRLNKSGSGAREGLRSKSKKAYIIAGLRGPDLRFPPTTKPGVPRQAYNNNNNNNYNYNKSWNCTGSIHRLSGCAAPPLLSTRTFLSCSTTKPGDFRQANFLRLKCVSIELVRHAHPSTILNRFASNKGLTTSNKHCIERAGQ